MHHKNIYFYHIDYLGVERTIRNIKMKTLTEAMKLQLFVQILFGQSPFLLWKNKIRPNRYIELYYIVSMCVYPPSVMYIVYNMLLDPRNIINNHGYLWTMIASFEILFTNIAFPLLLLYSFMWRQEQIKFWTRLLAIDKVLHTRFKVDFKPIYVHLYRRILIVFVVFYIYYSGISAGLLYTLIETRQVKVHSIVFSLIYQIEQCATGLLTISVINVFQLVRTRFRLLQNFCTTAPTVPVNENNRAEVASLKARSQQISTWTLTFKEMCALIDLLSKKLGMLLMLRFAHDFTLLTSQFYLIFWIMRDNKESDKYVFVVLICYWMVQNAVKIGGIGWMAHVTANEVYDAM